jgi:hypothetical protein
VCVAARGGGAALVLMELASMSFGCNALGGVWFALLALSVLGVV